MLQGNGGISRYFFELMLRLGKFESVQPTLFAGLYLSELPLHTLRRCRIIGMRRPFRLGPAWPVVFRLGGAANQFLLRRLAPAIYHPTYYRPAARPPGTRLVMTVYDMIHENFPEFYRDHETIEIKRRACEAADAIICISESTRRDLLGYYPEFGRKTSVVYLAAAEHFGAGQATAAPPPTGGPPYALFVGSRKDYKGFDIALEAWQQTKKIAPDLKLVCAGGGAFSSQEIAEFQRRDLGGLISQLPANDAKLAELYRNAVVFIYPSRYEGFGLPILEAMACGCPVVCSHSSSLPEVGGTAASYFEPGESADLASKVIEVYGDPERRLVMVQAGYRQRGRFSWDECARQTAQVYRKCMEAATA